jgi:hypothetical protein
LSVAASGVGTWAWSLVKAIPGIGTVAGIIGQMAIAGSVTAALGYGFLSLVESGKEVNSDSLKKAMEDNESKAEEKAKEIKRFGEAMKKVGFKNESEQINKELKLTFNLSDVSDPRILILSLNGDYSDEITEINKDSESISIDSESWPTGEYFITLKSTNLPDIAVKVEKI